MRPQQRTKRSKTGVSTAVLYTPDVLALAIELARHPLTDDLPLRGEARSRSCGSTIALGLAFDDAGAIARVGLRSHACAIGQASAAIFARNAPGASVKDILATRAAVVAWLAGEGALPQWPGFAAISAARDYPARHGAVLLPWDAAVEAISRI
ncbi:MULTISPECIES: iron-sulfur cluster assembly scaffold protein [Novosphingobium]|jgi:NifU-like protein involved in Fe-S cluster formation|uniref:iron-sulfur cluster assembly scaffold protein n=1 Tax=Novosphingobium TaxID=165696 RepID=UPI0022F287F3|nr:iron-sulfur cluster assembly scaffold protein [Novosphingobium resinovorum]